MEAEEKDLYAFCWAKPAWNWTALAFDWPAAAAILATDAAADVVDAAAHLNGNFRTDLADALADTLSMVGLAGVDGWGNKKTEGVQNRPSEQ